jgi:hypothetical protein
MRSAASLAEDLFEATRSAFFWRTGYTPNEPRFTVETEEGKFGVHVTDAHALPVVLTPEQAERVIAWGEHLSDEEDKFRAENEDMPTGVWDDGDDALLRWVRSQANHRLESS